MKRTISLFMISLVLFSVIPHNAIAREFTNEFYYVDDYYETIYNMYDVSYGAYGSSWDWFFNSDESFVYVQTDKVFDGSDSFSRLIDISISAIDGIDLLNAEHSLDNTTVQYYEIALISLMKTVEQNLLSNNLAIQENTDATMTPLDYIIEAAGFASTIAGIPQTEGVEKGLQHMINATDSSISILDNALSYCEKQEDYDKLNELSQVYSSLDLILTAIEDYPNSEHSESIGFLKIAARNVQQGLYMTLAVNLHNFNEFLEPSVNELTSFVFTDILEAVTEESAKDMLGTVSDEYMDCLSLMANAAKLLSSWNAGVEAGVFICDIAIGSSDTLLRYFEIRAMAGVRRALLYQAEKLRVKISGPKDFEFISLFGQYLYSLLYTSARGEYCVYRLQKADAHLLTIMVDGVSLDAWYETLIERIANMTNDVSALYPNPDYYLREESTDEYESTTVKRLTKVIIFENGSLHSEEHFTYNEAGLISEIKSFYYPDDGYGNKESTTTLIYDSENRLTSKSSFVPGAATGYYAMYTYNEAGQLASSDSRDGGHVTYEYSADGKLIRDVRSLPVGTPATSEYIYDNNGLLAEIRTTDGGGTYSLRYTYNQDGQIAETKFDVYTDIYCYDYNLFELITTRSIEINETTARILDVMDHEIYCYTFTKPEYLADDEGYLVRVTDSAENRVYEFQYSNAASGLAEKKNSIYNQILQEYRDVCIMSPTAFFERYNDGRDDYPNINSHMMSYYHQYQSQQVRYAYYDIDKNGEDELLIGMGGEYGTGIIDVYAHDGKKPVKLIDEPSLGERSQLTICTDGTLYLRGSGGAAVSGVTFYRLDADSDSLMIIKDYYHDGNKYPDATPYYDTDEYNTYISKFTEVNDVEWYPMITDVYLDIPTPYSMVLDQYREALKFCQQYYDSAEIMDSMPDFGDINTSIPLNTLDAMGLPAVYEGVAYALFDLNQDGTDELLVGGFSDDHFRIGDIFTLKNNNTVRICQAEDSWFGGIRVYANGLIREYEESGPLRYDWFYKIDNAQNSVYIGGIYQEAGTLYSVDPDKNILDYSEDITAFQKELWEKVENSEQWNDSWTPLR